MHARQTVYFFFGFIARGSLHVIMAFLFGKLADRKKTDAPSPDITEPPPPPPPKPKPPPPGTLLTHEDRLDLLVSDISSRAPPRLAEAILKAAPVLTPVCDYAARSPHPFDGRRSDAILPHRPQVAVVLIKVLNNPALISSRTAWSTRSSRMRRAAEESGPAGRGGRDTCSPARAGGHRRGEEALRRCLRERQILLRQLRERAGQGSWRHNPGGARGDPLLLRLREDGQTRALTALAPPRETVMNPRLTTLFETGGATGGRSVSSGGAASAQARAKAATGNDHGTFAPDALATSPSATPHGCGNPMGAATPSAARTCPPPRKERGTPRGTLTARVV